jgi:hypothetical protein
VYELSWWHHSIQNKILTHYCRFSKEAEFMVAYDAEKMILFVHRFLWDLGIPQEAATLLYEDNNACMAIGNGQKPTPWM